MSFISLFRPEIQWIRREPSTEGDGKSSKFVSCSAKVGISGNQDEELHVADTPENVQVANKKKRKPEDTLLSSRAKSARRSGSNEQEKEVSDDEQVHEKSEATSTKQERTLDSDSFPQKQTTDVEEKKIKATSDHKPNSNACSSPSEHVMEDVVAQPKRSISPKMRAKQVDQPDRVVDAKKGKLDLMVIEGTTPLLSTPKEVKSLHQRNWPRDGALLKASRLRQMALW